MNTHDKGLPPLPEHDTTCVGPDGYPALAYRKNAVLLWGRAAIEPYAQRIAELEAQIEADRMHRGEPVALTLGQRAVAAELLGCLRSWEPMVCVLGNVRARDGADLMQAILNAAPQPAEPVVKHSLTDAEPVKVTQRHDLGFIRSDSAMNAEPVKHPSYDADCCQGHNPNSDCKCAAYDADPSVTPQEEEAWQQMEKRKS